MKKLKMDGLRWLLLLCWAANLAFGVSAFAEGGSADNPKGGKESSGNDAQLANMFSVRQDYFKRYPFSKNEEDVRKGGRQLDQTKPQKGSTYELKGHGIKLEIPAGELISAETGPVKSPDPYTGKRPQYRPLFAYVGGIPGAFLPAPQPGMQGTRVPNNSKIATGEGGNVMLDKPKLPIAYLQPLLTMENSKNLSQEGDQAIFEYELTTFGVGPISDTQFQMIDREDNQRFLELFFDPERWMWTSRAAAIMQQQQMGTNLANTADHSFDTSTDTISGNLINLANEDAASPATGHEPQKTKAQAVYMVQQMYKHVFIPMALLLLLPGAVMTQMKSMVQFGVMTSQDESDTKTPFQGIIRSIIAIFLIPATQLIVSYMIDVGNSMAYEVRKWVDAPLIKNYAHEQLYGPQRNKTYNCLVEKLDSGSSSSPSSPSLPSLDSTISLGDLAEMFISFFTGNGIDLGKAYGGSEKDAVEEKAPQLSKQLQLMYNLANCGMSNGIVVLAEFQFVLMSYLFLLGPIAGAFYAWPAISKPSQNGPGLFNAVFANWLDAVVVLSLWRFWWMVVLACLTTYIQWSIDMGWFDPHSEWEMMVLTSFNVLILIVPFAPFSFSAKEAIKAIEQGQEKKGGKK